MPDRSDRRSGEDPTPAPVSEGAPPDLIGDLYDAILDYARERLYAYGAGSLGKRAERMERAVARVADAKAALQAHVANLEEENARLTMQNGDFLKDRNEAVRHALNLHASVSNILNLLRVRPR